MQRISEVIDAVWKKRNQMRRDSRFPDEDINIAIYMDYEYYYMCKSEITDGTTASVHDFFDRDTILGFQVYKVVPAHIGEGEIKHPPFRVVSFYE